MADNAYLRLCVTDRTINEGMDNWMLMGGSLKSIKILQSVCHYGLIFQHESTY